MKVYFVCYGNDDDFNTCFMKQKVVNFIKMKIRGVLTKLSQSHMTNRNILPYFYTQLHIPYIQ